MSARVSYAEVQEILDSEVDSGKITAFIEVANLWIDTYLQEQCPQLTAALLTQIERFLAAHLVSSTVDQVLVSASRGDISETYARGLGESPYLNAAALLDPCGIVRVFWMGPKKFMFKIGTGYAAEA